MKLSDRTSLTAIIESSVAEINAANGYRTSIGNNTFVAIPIIDDLELPAAIIIPGAENPAPDAGPNGHVVVQYQISGYVNLRDSLIPEHSQDPGAEYAQVDAIIADIRQALEGDGCALSGYAESTEYLSAIPHYHQRGGESCGATISYAISTPFKDYIPGQ